ncbi:MAG: histidinol-phosphatase [Magnetovibrio sp.]|nr:histidinol-phosphatase [Magnetovibrio sp.]
MSEQLTELAAFAETLADAAAEISLKYFRTNVPADAKADASPVTIADRETETRLREMIEAAYPDHGVFGEEHGSVRTDAEFVWVLDPIDGTQSFVTGKPLYGTLIGLLRREAAVMGVMDMPALSERWIGVEGEATLFNGNAVQARECPNLDRAWLYATSPQMFTDDHFPRFEALRGATRRTIYGAECQAYGLLACGWVDIVCEDTMGPYDYVALAPIVEGAGGVMTDWSGRPLNLDGDGSVLAIGDKRLKDEVMAILAG